MRALFVDDEVNILNSLRRLTRRNRRQWQCVFLESPQDALRLLEKEPFDLIVSDMRMPRVDGCQVLARTAELHPGSIRVVLSGYAEPQSFVEASRWCHFYIPKPYDEQVICDMLDRAAALLDMGLDEEEKRTLGSFGALPVLPEIYRALDRLLAEEDYTVKAVAELIGQEPILLAKALQLTNSAYFGLPKPISSAEAAVIELGSEMLKGLLISISLFGGSAVYQRQLLLQSLAVAALARQIAGEAGASQQQRELVFNAAMLHLLGKLLLLFEGKVPEPEQGRYIALSGEPLNTYEAENGLSSSRKITEFIMRFWNLPSPLVELYCDQHNGGPALWLQVAIAFQAAEGRSLQAIYEGGLLPPQLQAQYGSEIGQWYQALM